MHYCKIPHLDLKKKVCWLEQIVAGLAEASIGLDITWGRTVRQPQKTGSQPGPF